MASAFVTKSIKDNSDELGSYISELKSWEKEAKKQDALYLKLSTCDMNMEGALQSDFNEDAQHIHEVTAGNRVSKINKNCDSNINKKNISDVNDIPKSDVSKVNEITDTKTKSAEKLKDEGNKYYSKGSYTEAVAKYTRAMPLDPNNPIIIANRAMAYIKLEEYAAAEIDCSRCLKLDPVYIKALLRRATARQHLNDKKQAFEDYKKVLELEPWNKDAKRELCKLTKEINSPQSTEFNNKMGLQEPLGSTNFSSHKLKDKSSSGKKIQIKEVKPTDIPGYVAPNVVIPIDKQCHLRSKISLINIPVVEVETVEQMDNIFISKSFSKNTIVQKTSKVEESSNTICPSIPPIPSTSHRFSLEWNKIKSFTSIAKDFILSIPKKSFKKFEFDIDLLCDIFQLLASEEVLVNDAKECLENLIGTRGFHLNLTFMDEDQKDVLSNLVMKLNKNDLEVYELKSFLK